MSLLKLYKEYKHDQKLRNLFFEFTPKALYGADFKLWYLKGGWNDNYHTYSLVNDQEMVANVSFSTMDLILDGQPIRGIQLATVGTLPQYRKQGLSRQLMEVVLEKCANDCELVFLFANEGVLDFYPKFGFEPMEEYLFKINISGVKPTFKATQLSTNSKTDFELITGMAGNRLPVTRFFGSGNYEHILLWHLIYLFNECIWYLPEEEVIVVAEIEANVLHLYDILSARPYSFEGILPKILSKSLDTVICYFTPELLNMDFQIFEKYEESPLFVKGNFPLNGQKFKFPALAQT